LVDFDDAGGDDVEEVAVVGDEDDGAGECAEVVFEPADGFGVEVVGGFVEEEEVGLAGEGAAECDAAFFSAGEWGDGGIEGWCAEGRGGGFDAGIEVPAVGVVDEVEEVGEFGIGAVAGFVAADGIDDVGCAGGDVFEDAEVAIEFKLLGEVSDAEAAAEGEVSGVCGLAAGEDFEE
jgi:hypothetical protein